MVDLHLTSVIFQNVDEFGIPVYHNVGIMRHDDKLTSNFILMDMFDDKVINQRIIQIVFRLIDNQRFVAMAQQEGENRCSFSARQSLFPSHQTC